MGCDKVAKKAVTEVAISIHAPMWGATISGGSLELLKSISIHAPMWGATLPCTFLERSQYISIHAPMWGATLILLPLRSK